MKTPCINTEYIADNCTEIHHYMFRGPVEAWDLNNVYDNFYLDKDTLFKCLQDQKDIVYFCGQSEEDDGYEHYQLYIISSIEISTSELRKLLYPVKFKVNMYLRKAESAGGALTYCTKKKSRMNGPWEGRRGGCNHTMQIHSLLKPVQNIDSYLELLEVNLMSERTKTHE